MKNFLFIVVAVYFLLASCTPSSLQNPEHSLELPQIEIQKRMEASSEDLRADSPLQKIGWNNFDNYAVNSGEIVPTLRDLELYLRQTIAYHQAEIDGEIELWSLDFPEDPKSAGKP